MCDIICRDKQIERRKTVYIYQRLKDLREDNENTDITATIQYVRERKKGNTFAFNYCIS